MGGIMRKLGMFAAMAMESLRSVRFELEKDHEIAVNLSNRLQSLGWI